MKFSRAERAHVADWWLSVDRTLLTLILTLAVAGLAASLIASPSVGIHLTGDPFYFVKRQAAGMVFALAAGVRRLAAQSLADEAAGAPAVRGRRHPDGCWLSSRAPSATGPRAG